MFKSLLLENARTLRKRMGVHQAGQSDLKVNHRQFYGPHCFLGSLQFNTPVSVQLSPAFYWYFFHDVDHSHLLFPQIFVLGIKAESLFDSLTSSVRSKPFDVFSSLSSIHGQTSHGHKQLLRALTTRSCLFTSFLWSHY